MTKIHLKPIQAPQLSQPESDAPWDLQWLAQAEGPLKNARPFRLTHGQHCWEGAVQWQSPGEGRLLYQGRQMPFFVLRQQNELTIWIQGQSYRFALQDSRKRGRGSAEGDSSIFSDQLTAPMPGSVLKVLVELGQTVEPKQPIVIMESMKMEMTLTASASAVVKTISVQAGQLVEIGTTLVEFSETETET